MHITRRNYLKKLMSIRIKKKQVIIRWLEKRKTKNTHHTVWLQGWACYAQYAEYKQDKNMQAYYFDFVINTTFLIIIWHTINQPKKNRLNRWLVNKRMLHLYYSNLRRRVSCIRQHIVPLNSELQTTLQWSLISFYMSWRHQDNASSAPAKNIKTPASNVLSQYCKKTQHRNYNWSLL